MFIFQIDPAKLIGVENRKGISQAVENPDSVLLRAMGRPGIIAPEPEPISPFPPGGSVPPNGEISPGMLLGKIMDLSNEYIIYAQQQHNGSSLKVNDDGSITQNIRAALPWESSNELFESLAQYTGTPSTPGKIHEVKSFLYGIMDGQSTDPSHDGKQDYNDVLSIWEKNYPNPPIQRPEPHRGRDPIARPFRPKPSRNK